MGEEPARAPDVSVVLPTYEEADGIVALVEAVRAHLADRSAEVLVVDDASPDGTADRVRAAFGPGDGVRLIVRSSDPGLAASILEGVEAARGELVAVMDADFNHDPAELPGLLGALADADVVIGSRFVPGGGMESRGRERASRLVSAFAGLALGTGVRDNLSGFFAMRRDALAPYATTETFRGYGDYFLRLLARAAADGLRIVERPAWYRDRPHGRSKSRLLRMLVTYTAVIRALRRERIPRLLEPGPPGEPIDDPPSIAVVVPLHDGAETIGDGLDSLLAQRLPPREILVVDDGSRDRGPEIVAERIAARAGSPGPRLELLRTDGGPRGPGVARRVGVERTRCALVAFLDDDCRAPADWTTRIVERMPADAVGIGGIGVVANPGRLPRLVWLDVRHFWNADPGSTTVSCLNAAFRREALDPDDFEDPRLPGTFGGEDTLLSQKVGERGRVVFDPTLIVGHRCRSTLGSYLRQQVGRGRSRTILSLHFPGPRVARAREISVPYVATQLGLTALVASALLAVPALGATPLVGAVLLFLASQLPFQAQVLRQGGDELDVLLAPGLVFLRNLSWWVGAGLAIPSLGKRPRGPTLSPSRGLPG